MSERAPYSRVYWEVMEDAKFDGIREDLRLLGAWTLLLIVADMAWPAPAFVPRTVSKTALQRLIKAELVDTLSGERYRIRGLDSERERRRDAARSGPRRDPNGTQTGPVREPDGSQAETKPSRVQDEDEPTRAGDPAVAYWELTGRFPTAKTLAWLDDLTGKYGHDAVIRSVVDAFRQDHSTQTLLGRAQDRLRAEARELDRREREAEQARLKEKRANPPPLDEWRAEYRRRLEEDYAA